MTTHESPADSSNTVKYERLAIDGLSIAYREAGDAANPQLVLLHGIPRLLKPRIFGGSTQASAECSTAPRWPEVLRPKFCSRRGTNGEIALIPIHATPLARLSPCQKLPSLRVRTSCRMAFSGRAAPRTPSSQLPRMSDWGTQSCSR